MPFCPCSDTHLFRAYEKWCNSAGERARRKQELIGLASKRPGWNAGKTQHTWTTLNDATDKVRKMVVPSDTDMADAVTHDKTHNKTQAKLLRDRFETRAKWMTAGYYAFEYSLGKTATQENP